MDHEQHAPGHHAHSHADQQNTGPVHEQHTGGGHHGDTGVPATGMTAARTSAATSTPVPTSWRTAAQATLHCLTGCAIGEVLGMVIGTALGWSAWPTVALAVVLAFVFGYALTMRGVLLAGVGLQAAFTVALAADTVSIALMEILDNAVMLAVPGAMDAGLSSWVFWASLAFALAVAFVLTTPVNRWLISRGRGHAVVHRHHQAH